MVYRRCNDSVLIMVRLDNGGYNWIRDIMIMVQLDNGGYNWIRYVHM